ncbi:MAG: hypothetical protein ACFB21_10160 [Opitutales bacterium]
MGALASTSRQPPALVALAIMAALGSAASASAQNGATVVVDDAFHPLAWAFSLLIFAGVATGVILLVFIRRATERLEAQISRLHAENRRWNEAAAQQDTADALQALQKTLEGFKAKLEALASPPAVAPEPPSLEPLPLAPLCGPAWPLPERSLLADPAFALRPEVKALWDVVAAYGELRQRKPLPGDLAAWVPTVSRLDTALHRYLEALREHAPALPREQADQATERWRQGLSRDLEAAGIPLLLKRVYPGARFDSEWMHAVDGTSGTSVREPLSWALAEANGDAPPRLIERARVRLA